jgi:hypothetical protein
VETHEVGLELPSLDDVFSTVTDHSWDSASPTPLARDA